MTDLPLPADAGQRLDPARPIPPAAQPARLAMLEAAVREFTPLVPEVGIVLGSGLGGLADDLEDAVAIPFADLPGWPAATAPGHAGRLLLGTLGGKPVVMLQGRFHLYEGNHPGLVIQPVLLFQRLGATVVVLTNAAGGLDPSFGPGTLMVMRDHLNLTGQNPLMGPNADELGPRFPDLTDAWSPRLRERLHAAAKAEAVDMEEGIYVGLTGPNYETPGRGPDVCGARRPRGRHVDGPRVHRGTLGGPGGLRRLARDERRCRVLGRAADPRGGAGGRRDRRAAAGPRHPQVRLGAAPARGLIAWVRRAGRLARPARARVRQACGRSRPLALAAAAFSAQAPRTLSLCGRIGQCSSRFLNSSQ